MLMELLVIVTNGFDFRDLSWRFGIAVGGGRSSGRFMSEYIASTLK